MAGCPGNGIIAFNADGRDECLDCSDQVREAEAAQTKIYIGIGLVVLIAIIVMVVIKKVK